MDRIVRLYDLPSFDKENLQKQNINIRLAKAYEKKKVLDWIKKHFSQEWADEADVAFANHPISCFIATKERAIVGFACFEATCKNFFGPIGIDKKFRGKGVGKALLLASLHEMKHLGYAYAIIGGGDGVEGFYKSINAQEIEGSTPGIYRDFLK